MRLCSAATFHLPRHLLSDGGGGKAGSMFERKVTAKQNVGNHGAAESPLTKQKEDGVGNFGALSRPFSTANYRCTNASLKLYGKSEQHFVE